MHSLINYYLKTDISMVCAYLTSNNTEAISKNVLIDDLIQFERIRWQFEAGNKCGKAVSK